MNGLSQKLSKVDELETWKEYVQGLSSLEVAQAYQEAIPLWVHRMISENKLFLHPDVIQQLQDQHWLPND